MNRKRTLFLTGGLLMTAALLYMTSLFFDPIVNYYGIRLRNSQLYSLLANTPGDPNFGLYCLARPLTNLAEQSICFDTSAELEQFMQRRDEVERQITGL